MITTVILSNDRTTSAWSGGETSTVFQYPRADEYLFRVSIATITKKNTFFTPFLGFKRLHLLLEGTSRLSVDDSPIEMRGFFPKHCFDGGANCTCQLLSDSARAFNIIHAPSLSVEANVLIDPKVITLSKSEKPCYDIVFCIDGDAVLNLTPAIHLMPDDCVVLFRTSTDIEQTIYIEGSCRLVHARIIL